IVGQGFDDKINHAYAYGGIAMTVDTVEQFIGVPIDYYVKINMDGLQHVIESLDGVEVDNPFEWSDKGFHYPKGKITINGKQAMWYVRMRKLDPEGDFGRQKRQQQVITAIVDKATSPSALFKLPSFVKAVSDQVETNVPFGDALTIANKYLPARKQIDSLTLEGEGIVIDGVWYFDVYDDSHQQATEQIKAHLGLTEQSPVAD
ncbi:MAG: LCP family protein, partial [Bacilli bacterium]